MSKIDYNTIFTNKLFTELYINQQLNPYEIAKQFKCNHKTVRSYLKKNGIQLRNCSEYNSLARKTYTEPTLELLDTPLSLILHSIYKCEGTNLINTLTLCFCNQDVNLIKQFCFGMQKIYKYESTILFSIEYNFHCTNSELIVGHYKNLLSNFPNSAISYCNRIERKNPIIRVRAGGKRLGELFLKNMNNILGIHND